MTDPRHHANSLGEPTPPFRLVERGSATVAADPDGSYRTFGEPPDESDDFGGAVAHGPSGSGVIFGRSPTAVYQGDVAVGDLGELLSAVKARLRRTVGEGSAFALSGMNDRRVQSVRVGVLDCVSALDQIQSTVTRELDHCNEIAIELADTQAALSQALAELAGTRAGERHARHLAQHDSLTSLPNRGYFLERLDEELASLAGRRQTLAVLYLDLDEFKPINDRYGHDMGDELLRIVGVRLSRSVRIDDMVCRLGGDEFGCLLVDVQGRAQLGVLARKLIDAIAAPLQVGKRKLVVRPSVGIAIGPANGTTSEELLRSGDQAMYRAKRQRTGYAFFDATVDE